MTYADKNKPNLAKKSPKLLGNPLTLKILKTHENANSLRSEPLKEMGVAEDRIVLELWSEKP